MLIGLSLIDPRSLRKDKKIKGNSVKRNRAYRREQFERIKIKVRHWRGHYPECTCNRCRGDAKSIGQAARTRASCSCPMCGNPRKHFGELTPQERRMVEKK